MSWIRKDNNMKNEDEDDFFLIEAKKNEYIHTSTVKEQRKTNYSFLNYQGTKVFVPQTSKERRKTNAFVPQLSK
jgi:hypothetical protein